ncbi:MAG: glycosyltransferase family 4 protein [Planctomycetaceae bacterium]|nr:glycosyltransferase family 4 protein [Planctomycetaceae bacterium]
MRIIEMVSGTAVNGAVVTCLEITRAMLDLGHEVTLVCRPNSWIAEQLEGEVDIVYSSLKRWPTHELRRVASIARDRQIDVIHTHMSSANFFGVLLRRFWGIPCVATANNRYIQLHWMFNDHVVAASEATRKFHQRYNLVPKRRIEVVYNFIDDRRFHHVPADAGLCFRQSLDIDEDALLIGAVGDVLQRKGLLYLVKALPRIIAEIPRAHLVSVGYQKKPYINVVLDEAKRLGVQDRITWAGYRNDVVNVMSGIDVMTLPTLEDNLPLAILEAMACSVPVVASNVGGIPECVIDGQTGYLVPPAQPQPLVTALTNVLGDQEHRLALGAAGRQRIRENFSRESQLDRIEQVFQRFAA